MKPVTGWRKFSVSLRYGEPCLKGYYCEWPGPLHHAECLIDRLYGEFHEWRKGYETPTKRQLRCIEHLRAEDWGPHQRNIACGIYIIPTREELDNALDNVWPVEAEVTGWGVTAEMDLGWRVEFCRLDRVYLRRDRWSASCGDPEKVREALVSRYHVPVEVAP